MPVTVVIGALWGDEGKGKIVDYLAQNMDVVVRFNGGPNAGHTVENEYGKFALHLVPSGIFNPGAICIMGNGMVINPELLVAEIKELEKKNVSCRNLKISRKAHLIMPRHLRQDRLQEQQRGKKEIGTTLRGVGPAYSDKAARFGVRVEDLPRLGKKYLNFWKILNPYICQTEEIIWQALEQDRRILLEGAQGTLLDIDFGTYPHVTSSVCTVNGALQGSGVPWNRVAEVIGVVKAYATRVGSKDQPLLTEIPENLANILREQAHEYGATTGRPRRIAWLDAVQLRYVARINGFTSLAITRLDNLGVLPEVKICYDYTESGEPIYQVMPGDWSTDLRNCKKISNLPRRARKYVERIEELVGIRASLISVGPERDQIIVKR